MTREEKINLLNGLLEYEEKNDIGNLTRAERGEFQQWVKALEQEPKNCEDCEIVQACVEAGIRSTSRALSILDKIRAEIMNLDYIDEDKYEGTSIDPQISRDDVFEIIDKYKAESEVEK